jgi:molybdate transport system permease protein
MAAAFASVDRKFLEASWLLGVSRAGTFLRIVVPQSIAGLVTGVVLSFAHTLGEFGVVLMVGGNIEGITRTASIDIYDDVQAMNYAGANSTALLLLVFSFLVLSLVYAFNRKVWAAWPDLRT